jgi:pimeloyl-ACP methyl ester carboxylesterase
MRPETGVHESAERLIEANGVELCTQAFGDPAHPPILLIMGMSASMIWWDEDFCRMLAAGGRYVIRYDHRDTGRSVTYEPGHPQYSGDDLVADAPAVLDAYDLPAAHLVGVSMGGALAQLLALDYPDRVSSLVLINTSPSGPGSEGLPQITDRYAKYLATAEPDWSSSQAAVESALDEIRVLTGDRRSFDEGRVRELVTQDIERARNIASAQNHALLSGGDAWRQRLASITAPTLVIHGTADPMFRLEHGQALAREIPGASLLTIDGGGHLIHPADWNTLVRAILEHTTETERSTR